EVLRPRDPDQHLRPGPRVQDRARRARREGQRSDDPHGPRLPRGGVPELRREAQDRIPARREGGHGEHRLGSPVDPGDDVRGREEAVRLGHLSARNLDKGRPDFVGHPYFWWTPVTGDKHPEASLGAVLKLERDGAAFFRRANVIAADPRVRQVFDRLAREREEGARLVEEAAAKAGIKVAPTGGPN